LELRSRATSEARL